MDVKPVPTEGRGSRLRRNDGFQGTGMTGFRGGNDGIQGAGMTGFRGRE